MIGRLAAPFGAFPRKLAGGWVDVECFVLPQRCPGCGAPAAKERLLCEACWAKVPRIDVSLCARCLARERDPSSCSSHPGFRVAAAWVYDERMAAVLQAFKFESRRGLGATLGAALAQSLPIHYRPDLVLEVPLHPVRFRERGYNQAALLADALAERLHAPRLQGGLRRVRPTPPQTGLGTRERRQNLRGAFTIDHPLAFRDREVLVVDDVLTTGSTLEACLAELRAAGASARGVAVAWAS